MQYIKKLKIKYQTLPNFDQTFKRLNSITCMNSTKKILVCFYLYYYILNSWFLNIKLHVHSVFLSKKKV